MLLDAAERDVLALQNMTAAVPGESYGSHVQQAADESFQGLDRLGRQTYPLTHNLEALVNQLAERAVDTKAFRELSVYMPYVAEFRYGGVDSSTEPIDREEALGAVEVLPERVRGKLEEMEGA